MWRFEDVTFGYNEDKVILKDISLFAKPGQKLAFVGSTGAGKTTITNLINRFYDIQEGKIRYDGINITKIKKDDLRRSLGIVLQDTHLFTGTIRDNIRYGNLDATDEQIHQAAKLAHADQFIQMLPNGYDTMLSGDGEELSRDSASCFLSQELPWQIHRFSSSMKQRPASIPVPRVLCKKVWIT